MSRPEFGWREFAAMVLYMVSVRRVEADIPDGAKAVEFLPGMTLGGYYISRQVLDEGFSGEFGIIPAFVACDRQKGFFLSRLLTSRSGVTGGMHGTGANDAMSFVWQDTASGGLSLSVLSAGSVSASVEIGATGVKVPFMVTVPFFMPKGVVVDKGNDTIISPLCRAHLLKQFHLTPISVSIPEDSVLAGLPVSYKVASILWEPGEVVVRGPAVTEGALPMKARIFEVT